MHVRSDEEPTCSFAWLPDVLCRRSLRQIPSIENRKRLQSPTLNNNFRHNLLCDNISYDTMYGKPIRLKMLSYVILYEL